MDGRQSDLEAVFALGGIWSELLGRAVGYVGTQMWCESSAEHSYRVLDRWWSHREFEMFRERFQNGSRRIAIAAGQRRNCKQV